VRNYHIHAPTQECIIDIYIYIYGHLLMHTRFFHYTQERVAVLESGEEVDEVELENEQYLERLDEGLFTLQMIDFIAAEAMFGEQTTHESPSFLFSICSFSHFVLEP